MRSYNNLYEPMLQDDYIKQRFINASKKKKNRNDVREVLENLDEHTELLKKDVDRGVVHSGLSQTEHHQREQQQENTPYIETALQI